MIHYICTGGCKSESQGPGVCESPACPDYGESLKECDCEDGKHYGSFGEESEKEDWSENDS